MIAALVLVLSQTAAATPRSTPAPTAIPRADTANSGLAGAGSRVKLNRGVKFDDVGAAKPTPGYTPATSPDCDSGGFKITLGDYASRFAGELKTARSTPRIALAGQISRLRSLRGDLFNAGVKAPKCAVNATAAGIAWMDLEISGLDEFLGQRETGAEVYGEHAADMFEKFMAELRVLR